VLARACLRHGEYSFAERKATVAETVKAGMTLTRRLNRCLAPQAGEFLFLGERGFCVLARACLRHGEYSFAERKATVARQLFLLTLLC
jgi:hypothetical protein